MVVKKKNSKKEKLNQLEKGKIQNFEVQKRGKLVEVTDEILEKVCFALYI